MKGRQGRMCSGVPAEDYGPSPTLWHLPRKAVCSLSGRTGHFQICVPQGLGSLLFPSVPLFVPEVRNWVRNTRSSRTRVSHDHFPAVVIALCSLGKTRALWPRSHWHVHFSHLFRRNVLTFDFFNFQETKRTMLTLVTRGNDLE